MARKALGRGLDALLPVAGATEAEGEVRLAEIDIDRIRPNPQQPREAFDEHALEQIAQSLREHGVLQPVVVRSVGDRFELIAGERRWRAAQRAGMARIPAIVRDADRQQALELALIENLQREDLNPMEEAAAYEALIGQTGLTQEQVAARVGKDRSTVTNTLRLLKLPEEVRALVATRDLGMGHARALLGLGSAGAQRRLARAAVDNDWSVRQVEARVRADRRPAKSRTAAKRDPDVVAAEEKLNRALGAPVRIRGREKGRIEIRFGSLEELDRIFEALLTLRTRRND